MKFIILFIANSYLTKIIPLFIRRERGMCRICYSAAPNEFDVSYKDADKGYIGAAVSGIHEISGRKINALKKKRGFVGVQLDRYVLRTCDLHL